jgi:hypothetical protein
VQSHLLAQYPSADLRVYAVWLAMLGGDAREMWDGNTMPDPRVKHFWDGEYILGQWFAKEVDGYEGIAWDIYYLYGPEATWESVPSPLIAEGGTIYGERKTLEMKLSTLMGGAR